MHSLCSDRVERLCQSELALQMQLRFRAAVADQCGVRERKGKWSTALWTFQDIPYCVNQWRDQSRIHPPIQLLVFFFFALFVNVGSRVAITFFTFLRWILTRFSWGVRPFTHIKRKSSLQSQMVAIEK